MAPTLTSPTSSRLTKQLITIRRGAMAGMLGPVMFGVLIVLLTRWEYAFLRGLGWHPLHASDVPWPSSLALGPYGWLQVVNFVCFGLLLIAFATGLHRGITAGTWAKAGPTLLVVAGMALALSGFKTDPHLSQGPQTISGWIHGLAFLLLLGSLVPAVFIISRRLRTDARWRGYDWYSLGSGLVAVVLFFVPAIGFYLFLVVILAWIEVMALRLWVIAQQLLS